MAQNKNQLQVINLAQLPIQTCTLEENEYEIHVQAIELIAHSIAESINESTNIPGLISVENLQQGIWDNLDAQLCNATSQQNVAIIINGDELTGVIIYGTPEKIYQKRFDFQIHQFAISPSHQKNDLSLKRQLLVHAIEIMLVTFGMQKKSYRGKKPKLVMRSDPLTQSDLDFFSFFGAKAIAPETGYQLFDQLNIRTATYVWHDMYKITSQASEHAMEQAINEVDQELQAIGLSLSGGADLGNR